MLFPRLALTRLLLVLLPVLGLAAGEAATGAAFASFHCNNRLDELVLERFKAGGVAPSAPCSDEVFLRRVFIDVIGTLPTVLEARTFLADKTPDRRRKLIDQLLARDEFADYWALKWGDLLRIKSEFPSNLWPNAVQAYHQWVRGALRANLPYDRFARELLTSSGSNFRVPPVNFFRAFQERKPELIAENVALVFMGLRLGDSGFSPAQVLGMSAFFAKVGYKTTEEWKEEIVLFNPEAKPLLNAQGQPVVPATPDGKVVGVPSDKDPRVAFADWLTMPGNPWFARAIANRTWFWLLGRGLVQEPDDMRPGNPPWSAAVLDHLAQDFTAQRFDLRHLFRTILISSTYQLASEPNAWNTKDADGFARYRLRRLDAEPLLDAICQVTGITDRYSSPIPEPFTFLPADQRAICLADGSMESMFLESFGRPPRNSSFESERSAAPSILQAQHMLNSSHVQQKIERSGFIRQLTAGKQTPTQCIEALYLRILSRFPTADEKRIALAYAGAPGRKAPDAAMDLAWALINTKEFIFRH